LIKNIGGNELAKESSNSTERLAGEFPIDIDLPLNEQILRLRVNALMAHQHSVGRGDALVEILRSTLEQMRRAHNRIQNMSTALFIVGLILVAAGIYGMVFGGQGQEVWAAILGGTGGLAALAAIFWTAPLDKISASITDLVKLETAFLGYIRVIGQLDSTFQMHYLDILRGSRKISLDQVINDTTNQTKDIMELTMSLIDKYLTKDKKDFSEVQKQVDEIERRLKSME
jgi:hypothetical protein